MAKITKTTYVCDICKKEFDEPRSIAPVPVMGYEYDCEGRGKYPAIIKTEMCYQCAKRRRKITEEHFVVVTSGYGNTLTVKEPIK